MTTTTFYVGDSDDDAFERKDASMGVTQDYVFVYDNTGTGDYYHGGFRFVNVTIPQGATVSAAKFSGYAYDSGNDNIRCTIYGHDADNGGDFTENAYITNQTYRPRTSASVLWEQDDLGAPAWVDKTGLQSIIQEIVNRPGWSSGNAIVLLFIIPITSLKRVYFRSWDYNDHSYKAKLEVTYSAAGLSIPVAMRHYRNLRTAITRLPKPTVKFPKFKPRRI